MVSLIQAYYIYMGYSCLSMLCRDREDDSEQPRSEFRIWTLTRINPVVAGGIDFCQAKHRTALRVDGCVTYVVRFEHKSGSGVGLDS